MSCAIATRRTRVCCRRLRFVTPDLKVGRYADLERPGSPLHEFTNSPIHQFYLLLLCVTVKVLPAIVIVPVRWAFPLYF